MKPKLVIVLGPTAVGKSDMVLDLALQSDAEIISADSQQVYRHMDIGTAKPSKKQREKIPHHLIDVVDPDVEIPHAGGDVGHPRHDRADHHAVVLDEAVLAHRACVAQPGLGVESARRVRDLPVQRHVRDIDVVLSDYTTWDWRTDAFGIMFPPGTELILEEMNFRHWTPMERLIGGWKSFWTCEGCKP